MLSIVSQNHWIQKAIVNELLEEIVVLYIVEWVASLERFQYVFNLAVGHEFHVHLHDVLSRCDGQQSE
jgi:hypothetical protein